MNGLYYQRGIKLKHVVEKGAQYFTKERINMALTNIHNFVKRERNKEQSIVLEIIYSFHHSKTVKLHLVHMEPQQEEIPC